jgi:hypothetical protein
MRLCWATEIKKRSCRDDLGETTYVRLKPLRYGRIVANGGFKEEEAEKRKAILNSL